MDCIPQRVDFVSWLRRDVMPKGVTLGNDASFWQQLSDSVSPSPKSRPQVTPWRPGGCIPSPLPWWHKNGNSWQDPETNYGQAPKHGRRVFADQRLKPGNCDLVFPEVLKSSALCFTVEDGQIFPPLKVKGFQPTSGFPAPGA